MGRCLHSRPSEPNSILAVPVRLNKRRDPSSVSLPEEQERLEPSFAKKRSDQMTSAVFLIYSLIHLVLFTWATFLFIRYRHPGTVPLLIVAFGLIYDNFILFAGASIGHGDLLERLSIPRFFMHAFGTPLLMLAGLGLVIRTRAKWAGSRWVAACVLVLTLAMIAVGVDADFVSLQLQPKQAADLISYGNAATSGPPVAPIVTIIVLILAGGVVWKRRGGPWLLLGSIAQFAAAALGDTFVIVGNLGEVALLAGLIGTDSIASRHSADKVS